MPLKLANDLLQDRYTAVLRYTLMVLMVTLPAMLWLSVSRGDSVAQSGGVAVLVALIYALYFMLARRATERLVAPLLVFALIGYTTYDILAYGSVRSAGNIGYICAVVAAGIMLRARVLLAALTLTIAILGALTWAEATGRLSRTGFQVNTTFFLSYLTALLGVAIGAATSRRLVQQALRDQHAEFLRREQAEAARRQSDEQFSRVFQISPSGIMVQSVASRQVLDINPAFERMYGYERHEYFEPGHNNLLWTDEAQRATLLAELLAKGRLVNQEMHCRRKDGSRLYALISSEIGGEGDARIIVSTVTDISAEVRSRDILMDVAKGVSGETGEPFFRVLVQHLGRALDADRVIAGEVTGEGIVESLAVLSDGAIGAPARYELAGTPCGEALRQDGMCVYLDDVHRTFPQDVALADGGIHAYMGMALRDADGSPIGVLNALWRKPQAASSDREALLRIFASRANAELIRVRREREIMQLNETLEQRVAERTAELQATNAELESFAYSVSHDLQTPLRGIDGFTALIGQQLGGTLSLEQQRMFGRVRVNVARMGELINDLLGLAKVSKRELNRQPVDISALATAIGEAATQALPGRRIEIAVQPGLTADCDRNLAEIALENLVGNAVKYTRGRDPARIEIGVLPLHALATSTAHVFFIRDNGVGFDMSYADKLFKPFTRLHHEHEFEGSGIGLATVHRILERHGGGIAGSGSPGEGATFRFSFEAPPA